MLKTTRKRAAVTLEARDVQKALSSLMGDGWEPLGLGSDLFLAQKLGLDLGDLGTAPLRRRPTGTVAGDLFVRDGRLFYLVSTGDDAREGFYDDDVQFRRPPNSFEVGLVTRQETDSDEDQLNEFASAVVAGVEQGMDGRRFRHLTFEWETPSVGSGRLQELCDRLEKDGGTVRFRQADFTEDEFEASQSIAEGQGATLLQEISASGGFAIEADILKSRTEAEADLKRLTGAGLIEATTIVQCRQSSRPLTRVSDPSRLGEGEIAEMQCATCARRFADELLIAAYAVSELGSRLITGSHWMTIWVTGQLISAGVPKEQITWNLEESTEEIDIVIEFMNELWIMELKDRNFSPRDSHAFNYRRVRYRPDKSFIVTTGSVAPDARQVFDDVAADVDARRARMNGGAIVPTYIEGLSSVSALLSAAVAASSELFALRTMAAPAQAAGMPMQLLRKALSQ